MRIYHSIGNDEIASRKELLQFGFSRREIKQAEADGGLIRVDRCRYAQPAVHPGLLAAAKADATLTCLSALAYHGVWTMPTAELHLRRGSYGSRRRDLPPGARLCTTRTGATLTPVDSVEDALCAVIRHHDVEDSVAALDSLLHLRRYTRAELHLILGPTGVKGQQLLGRADGRAESILESVVRLRLRAAGFRPATQVTIDGVGRVDFLLHRRLIIEADGAEHHNTVDAFRQDRRRDRRAVARGYVVMRLTWDQVVGDWDDVLLDIRRALGLRPGP